MAHFKKKSYFDVYTYENWSSSDLVGEAMLLPNTYIKKCLYKIFDRWETREKIFKQNNQRCRFFLQNLFWLRYLPMCTHPSSLTHQNIFLFLKINHSRPLFLYFLHWNPICSKFKLPIAGFELLQICGVRRNCSTKCAPIKAANFIKFSLDVAKIGLF